MLNTILTGLICFQLNACSGSNLGPVQYPENMEQKDTTKIKITVGSKVFKVRLNNSATAIAFKAKLPLDLKMADLNGNEKHAELPSALPTKLSKPGTIQTGDLMLYGSDTLVLFYKTFSSSYTYSPIGRVDNPLELTKSLGNGNVTVKFELND